MKQGTPARGLFSVASVRRALPRFHRRVFGRYSAASDERARSVTGRGGKVKLAARPERGAKAREGGARPSGTRPLRPANAGVHGGTASALVARPEGRLGITPALLNQRPFDGCPGVLLCHESGRLVTAGSRMIGSRPLR